ncbi:MAG: hypothetical protein JKY43_09100 [Phycisphaerales bacterium]|nr:hypothetical protein [Phycisphaerales bacterium]
MKLNRKAWAVLVLGSATLLGGIAPAAVASDVRVSYKSSSYGYSSTAGILLIDGERFTIRSHRNIGRQIVNAFRRCGYDATIDRGKVVVCYDRYNSPQVRWYQRGYRASIYRDHGELSVSWRKVYRDRRYKSGWGYRNKDRCCDSWAERGHRHGKPRYVRRSWCD